jgi:hypothetical protein
MGFTTMAKSSLQFVDLIGSDGKPTPGLAPVSSLDTTTLSIDEQAAVFDAGSFKHVDFVFFRRFSDGRSSQISAYVVDNSGERHDEKALSELHRQVWLYGAAPLLYVAWPARIDVLTCARGPDFWKPGKQERQYNPVRKFESEALKTAGEINRELQKFSVDTLKGILKRSIYGIELDENAVALTAFSLSLAICDALQSEVIWRDLKFDPLCKSNLYSTFWLALQS